MKPSHEILTDGFFTVRGYRESSGKLLDLKCRICGREGYLELLRHSLDQLEGAYSETLKENPDFDLELASSAYDALRNSLLTRLDPKKESPEVRHKEALVPVSSDIFLKDGDPEFTVILRLEVVLESAREAPEAKTKKASAAVFRELLERKLPCGRYRHRLNLYPGKFEAVVGDDLITP
jgi:hypothetical protein